MRLFRLCKSIGIKDEMTEVCRCASVRPVRLRQGHGKAARLGLLVILTDQMTRARHPDFARESGKRIDGRLA